MMELMNLGFHHFNYNYKLPDQNSPIFKSPQTRRLINGGVYAAIILSLSATVPQIMKIWIDGNAEGVSVITWIGFTFSSIFWLIYGLIHQDKAIMISSAGGIMANLVIIAGVLTVS